MILFSYLIKVFNYESMLKAGEIHGRITPASLYVPHKILLRFRNFLLRTLFRRRRECSRAEVPDFS